MRVFLLSRIETAIIIKNGNVGILYLTIAPETGVVKPTIKNDNRTIEIKK